MKLTAPLIVITVLFSSCVLFGCLWNQVIVENPYLKKKKRTVSVTKSLFKSVSCFYLFPFFSAWIPPLTRLLRHFICCASLCWHKQLPPFTEFGGETLSSVRNAPHFQVTATFLCMLNIQIRRLDLGMLLGNN